MLYLILADIVVVIHFTFILYVIFGGLTLLRWPWMIWLHLPTFLWGMAILLFQFVCPLTPLENWLLVQGGAEPYQGGFIGHYLLPIIYTPGMELPVSVNTLLVLCTLFINSFIYGTRLIRLVQYLLTRLRKQ
ncbi:MAG: DUF2784 domain-containing protein [Gammaproteobacteria bacterium]|nr:DUF2784 domain-containing protein [Gammaproteobacteria bacterium]